MRRTIPASRGIDRALAAHRQAVGIEPPHHVIAEGVPAARLARLDAAAQAAPRLVGEVLQEQRAHRAFQADMQLVHLAFGERDDPHAGKARALVDMGDILLVARQPVDGFGDDHLELAGLRILQQHLHAGTDQAGARDRMVGVAVDDAPALALRALLAQADLVLDRGVALQVGGIAGVDGGGRHDECLSLFALSLRGLSLGVPAADSSIISLGGGAGKQLYKLDEHRIMRGDRVVPRLFCLPILLGLVHAGTVP